MRTTIRLDDNLLEQAKREAAKRGETLTALFERALRLALAKQPSGRKHRHVELPISKAGGGTLPGIDLDDSANLLEVLEGRR
jgi:hypothetical protein